MDKHKGKRLFITGIPTAGKSHLAQMIVSKIGGIHIDIDDIREEIAQDLKYKKWANFYLNQDEKTYYMTTTHDQQWQNLVRQSEGMWPAILEKIQNYANEIKPVIFEGVNILPHLAKKDLPFPGIAIMGKSFEEVFKRNKEEPRWGKTEKLQKLEAEAFFYGERPHYKAEAEKYGYPIFETANSAFEQAVKLIL
jgi:2-phosphoglycerate kinase